MSLYEVERLCRFYRNARMIDKEKHLLEKTLAKPEFAYWEWGITRMKEIDPGFISLMERVEPDITPTTREEIAHYSFQYQTEWRFEREKRIIQHALKLFPDWKYLHDRMEWHSRPTFHRDPEKSKTQPRKPLHLPRDPNYIPKQETIDSMCFVTGTSSNGPYFDLAVQLIESIKATRWYNHVTIKVLDCGLTQEDADYLRNRFGCEVKDPGWNVPIPQLANRGSSNGWKGMTARPYIHKHFPGYEYYFWVDADLWIQDEFGLDRLLCLCETQGIGIAAEPMFHWPYVSQPFLDSIPSSYVNFMKNKTLIHNGVYCISRHHNQRYSELCDQAIQERKTYLWGFDMSTLNYFFYKEINNIFIKDSSCFTLPHFQGVRIDKEKNLLGPDDQIVGIMCLPGQAKHHSYHFLFMNTSEKQTHPHPKGSDEEQSHLYCQAYGSIKGSPFYRIYPNPKQLYGDISEVLK